MPYKKKYSKRRRTKSSIAAIVKRVLNKKTETKHRTHATGAFDYIGNGVATRSTLVSLSDISQSVSQQGRVGNKVSLFKVNAAYVIRTVASANAYNQAVRVLLVQSRAGTLSTSDMPDYYNPVDVDKMIVIRDMLFNLSQAGADGGGSAAGINMKRLTFRLRGKSLPYKQLQYDDTVITPDKPLYLYMISESIGSVEFAGYFVTYFKDI